MPIGALNILTPGSGDVAGTSGPAELKDIKAQVRASFPNFVTGNDVVTKTAGQLNNSADKTSAETVTGSWTFTGTLNANGTVNFGGSAAVTGSWQFKANAVIADGKSLVLQNSTNTVSALFYHDGTNLNVEEVLGATDGFQIRDGIGLRVYDATDSEFIGISCNGVNSFLSTNSGSIQVSANGIFDIVDGAVFRIRDAGATDLADFQHNGTDFTTTFTNTSEWDITGVSAINLAGSPLATQAFLAASRGHGKMSLTLGSTAGTGSPVTQTGTTGTVLSNMAHTSGSGTLEATNSGSYRLKINFRAASWTGTPGTCGVKIKQNGVTDLLDRTFTVLSGEQNMDRDWEDFVDLAAGDDLQMQLNIPVGLTLNSGSITLLAERMT